MVDLLQTLNRFEAGISADRLTDRAAAESTYDALLARIAAHEGRLVVAVAEERIVGVMGFVIETDEPYIAEPVRRHGVVTDLVVEEALRGRGVGGALLAEAEKLAREAGLKRLAIGVLEGNAAAHRLYERFGFRDHGRWMLRPLEDWRGEGKA